MNKKALIEFTLILIFFLIYHFIYVYYNQDSVVNSDTIWGYSFSRDLIEGVNLKNFTFPPFYYFLDIAISFLPSLLNDYLLHSILVSPINILILIFFFTYFYKSQQKEKVYEIGILLILSTLAYYHFNILVSYFFSLAISLEIYPLLIINNYILIPGNHGLSTVMAIVLSYYFYFKENKKTNNLILYFLVFILSFSDFWFAIYFLPIIGIFYLINMNKKNFIDICMLTLIASAALVITYYTNDQLSDYRLTKNNKSVDDSIGFITIFFLIYALPAICFVYLYYKKNISDFIKCIFFGSFVSFIFIILTDNYSYLNMRFYVFILPVSILLIYEVFKIHLIELRKLFYISLFFLIFGIAQIINYNFTDTKMRNERTHFNFDDEIICVKNISMIKKYTVIADYWPGRIILESLNRKVNYISQQWIYNPAWANLNEANSIIIVKHRLYPDGYMHKELKALVEDENIKSVNYCNNKLIIIDNIKVTRKN